jgi:hypothetical protein
MTTCLLGIEHRTALDGKVVTVTGTVVRMLQPGDPVSRSPGTAPRPGRYPDTTAEQDPLYELMVLLPEGDAGYAVGRPVEIQGTVEGNRAAVVLRRRD